MNQPPDDLKDTLAPTPLPWQEFEEEVATYIKGGIDRKEIGVDQNLAKIIPKFRLFSKDRNADITFDVAIKLFSPLDENTPMFVWLWECKDYKTHTVPVDDVEEFHSKISQVGGHKGTMVTRVGLQSGAVEFARSRGIGLMTLSKRQVRALAMSQDCGIIESEEIVAESC